MTRIFFLIGFLLFGALPAQAESVRLAQAELFPTVPEASQSAIEAQEQSRIERARAECPADFARGCFCREKQNEENTPYGKCTTESQVCGDSVVRYSCCVCDQTALGARATSMLAESGQTFDSCRQLCQDLDHPGEINRQFGAGTFQAGDPAAPSPEQIHQQNALCFTPAECASDEYGKSPDAFRTGHGCPEGKGRCLAPEPELKLSFPIGGVTTVTGIRGFIATLFRFIVGIAATAAAVMFMYGGFRYIFGSAFQDITRAKEIMIDSLVGLVITLGSLVLMNTINPATTTLKKLDVYLVNKQQILGTRFCADIQTDKVVRFAEAGFSPEYKNVNDVEFTIAKDKTKCNSEYYAEGFGNDRCFGRLCQQPGTACISCESGLCETGADPRGFGCIAANFAGNIRFTSKRYVGKLAMFFVCREAVSDTGQAVEDFDGVHHFKDAQLQARETETGQQGYVVNFTSDELDDAVSECENEGGLAGFVLAMSYNDTGFSFGVGESVSGVEFASVGKSNCGSGSFAGYTPRWKLTSDEQSMQAAIYCGMGTNQALQNPTNYWTLAEMREAVGGSGEAPQVLICDFQLSDLNAPSDVDELPSTLTYEDAPGEPIVCGVL